MNCSNTVPVYSADLPLKGKKVQALFFFLDISTRQLAKYWRAASVDIRSRNCAESSGRVGIVPAASRYQGFSPATQQALQLVYTRSRVTCREPRSAARFAVLTTRSLRAAQSAKHQGAQISLVPHVPDWQKHEFCPFCQTYSTGTSVRMTELPSQPNQHLASPG